MGQTKTTGQSGKIVQDKQGQNTRLPSCGQSSNENGQPIIEYRTVLSKPEYYTDRSLILLNPLFPLVINCQVVFCMVSMH